jgi:hypothetical protein
MSVNKWSFYHTIIAICIFLPLLLIIQHTTTRDVNVSDCTGVRSTSRILSLLNGDLPTEDPLVDTNITNKDDDITSTNWKQPMKASSTATKSESNSPEKMLVHFFSHTSTLK